MTDKQRNKASIPLKFTPRNRVKPEVKIELTFTILKKRNY